MIEIHRIPTAFSSDGFPLNVQVQLLAGGWKLKAGGLESELMQRHHRILELRFAYDE